MFAKMLLSLKIVSLIIVLLDNQIIFLTTQRLSVSQNIVIGNSGRRRARAFSFSENGHARGVTRIMKVRSDNKEDGDANEDDDELYRNAG